MPCNFLALFSFLQTVVVVSGQRKLIYANIMFNYGNRAPPALVYPKDVNTENSWLRGFAHLSNLGMQEEYALGQFIKERYTRNFTLLPVAYTVDVISVLSSSHDRCLQSAEAVLAALYPPIDKQIWRPDMPWQPIPVHTSDEADPDPMMQPDDIACTNFNALLTRENANTTAQLNQQYASFFRYLENRTGIARIAFENISNLIYIENEITANLPQPAWINEIRPETNLTVLGTIHELARIAQDLRYNSMAKAKYGAGLMLAQWISNMQTAINDSTSITKAFLFSVQEGSITAMLSALGTGIHELTPYAACIFLELYQEGNQFFVEAHYRNLSTASSAKRLQLSYCTSSTNCTLSFADFVRGYQNLTYATNNDYLKVHLDTVWHSLIRRLKNSATPSQS